MLHNGISNSGNDAAKEGGEAARAAYQQALPLYQEIGDILGEADCIRSLGEIALARSDHEAALKSFDEALALYERIQEPHSIGLTHARLAQVVTGDVRARHLAAARSAWESINRPDLVALLEE